METHPSPITYNNWRSRTENATLRRFYESLDCGRLFNTRYLLDYTGMDLSGNKGRLALSIICHVGDEKAKSRKVLFEWLLREKCDFNLQDEEGLTLIAWLCKHNKKTLFFEFINKCLLDIDFTQSDVNKDIPLMHAVRTGDADMVKELVKTHKQFGISVDNLNKDGLTPYAEATRLSLKVIADILQNDGNASTNVYIEPIWSLKQPEHSFKDVMNNVTISNMTTIHDSDKNSKNLQDNKKKSTNVKAHENAKPSTLRKSRQNTVHPKYSFVKESQRTIRNDRSGLIKIEEPIKKPRKPVKKKQRKKSSSVMKKQTNGEEKLVENMEKLNIKPGSRCSSLVQGSDNSSGVRRLSVHFSDDNENQKEQMNDKNQPMGRTSPMLRMRRKVRRKSVCRVPNMSSLPFQDALELRVKYEEGRMQELMQYSPQYVNKHQQFITYADVNGYFPTSRVSSKSTVSEQLRWLLRLQTEQKDMPKIKQLLTKQDMKKINPPENTRSRFIKNTDIPPMPRRKSAVLWNAVFNRLLSG